MSSKNKNKKKLSKSQIDKEIKKIEKELDNKAQQKQCYKTCNNLLKRNPDSAELLALRASIYHVLPVKDDETFDEKKKLVKAMLKDAISKDVKNIYAWKKQAQILTQFRDYKNAIKCLKQVQQLSDESQRVQIAYDIALCQAMLEDYKGLVETRRLIVTDPHKNSAKWHAFAGALYLSGDHLEALKVINVYKETWKSETDQNAHTFVEENELAFLYLTILKKAGMDSSAIKYCVENKSIFKDELFYLEELSALYLKNANYAEAQKIFLKLLKINSENYNYHIGLQVSL